MDVILVLVIIGWVFSRMNKAASGAQKAKASRQKAERNRLQTEAGKRKAQPVQERKTVQPAAFREGEATSAYTPMEAPFRGSMQVNSTEGECICDPELEHERETEPAPTGVYAEQIGKEPLTDFSARGIMQGIVMSEILARPAQRTRRH